MLKLTTDEGEVVYINSALIKAVRPASKGAVIDMGETVYYVKETVEQIMQTTKTDWWGKW